MADAAAVPEDFAFLHLPQRSVALRASEYRRVTGMPFRVVYNFHIRLRVLDFVLQVTSIPVWISVSFLRRARHLTVSERHEQRRALRQRHAVIDGDHLNRALRHGG